MIIFADGRENDMRHTVAINNSYSHATAIQLNADGTYSYVTYMIDDMRTWNNECRIDATEEELEAYRKNRRQFREGDKVIIHRGRKMKNEQKIIVKFFTYRPQGTYGHRDVEYAVFTDGTKVNIEHCDFI